MCIALVTYPELHHISAARVGERQIKRLVDAAGGPVASGELYISQFRRRGGIIDVECANEIIAAHNAVLMASYMQDYLDAVKNDPELISVIAQTSSDGFSVSFRKSDQSGGEQ